MFPRVLCSPGKAFPAHISLGIRVSLTFSFEVHVYVHRRRKGGLGDLRMVPRRSYSSWSGAENRDKDRDTLIK